MFKNSDVKKLILIQILTLLLFLLLGVSFSHMVYNTYKIELINNNSNMVGSIVKNHPELQDEIINILSEKKYDNLEFGKEILNKYGLDDAEYIDYLENNNKLKNKIIIQNIIFICLFFIISFAIYLLFLKKQYKNINKIDEYMNNILNNNYSLDIRDYKEGDISNLKNNVYKMTVKLKEQMEITQKDKENLEETLSDISHQIRTPLTSMYVINDILSSPKLDEKEKKNF